MLLSTWLLYVAAVFVLTVTPGPSVLMCVSTAVNLGPRKALITSLGSTSAIVGLMTLSALGLGALLAGQGGGYVGEAAVEGVFTGAAREDQKFSHARIVAKQCP